MVKRLVPFAGQASLATLLAACSPAMEWREYILTDLPLAISAPCRPQSHARRIDIAGRHVDMALFACSLDGRTFAVGAVDAGDPALVGAMLATLASSTVANIHGRVDTDGAAEVPGMTPHQAARRQAVTGRSSRSEPMQAQLVVFSVGTLAFQAALLGPVVDADTAQRFFSGLRVVHPVRAAGTARTGGSVPR